MSRFDVNKTNYSPVYTGVDIKYRLFYVSFYYGLYILYYLPSVLTYRKTDENIKSTIKDKFKNAEYVQADTFLRELCCLFQN
jgi:hypothetical protein